MKSTVIRAIFLCIILLIGISCQRDLPQTPMFTDFDPHNSDEELTVIPQTQDSLVALWTASNHDQWDVISGTINPSTGGTISGTPASWPAGYTFSISVPANALPLDVTELEIHVPKHLDLPGSAQLPAVYKLEPDLQCLNDKEITVTVCYPPWLISATGYDVCCIFQTGSSPAYGTSDLQSVLPAGADKRKGLSFTTGHFSRWSVDGKQGG